MNKLTLPIAVGLVLAGLGASASASAATDIDSCLTITLPGTYVLTQDLTVADQTRCFVINSSNVTLDLGGHTLKGSGNGGGGIGVTADYTYRYNPGSPCIRAAASPCETAC